MKVLESHEVIPRYHKILVVHREDLFRQANGFEIVEIKLEDLNIKSLEKQKATKVIFIDNNGDINILKDRYNTERK